MEAPLTRYVFDFREGRRELVELLGGKGANLAEMTRLGLPVPPGFTITTEACRHYLKTTRLPEGLQEEVDAHLTGLEKEMGRRLGDADDPLLVSVRSGAAFSMPGMMETVLNVGLTEESVAGLAARSGDVRFAWDSYRRLVQMFGKTVLGVPDTVLEKAVHAMCKARGVKGIENLAADDVRLLAFDLRGAVEDYVGTPFPTDPREQLDLAVRAVFESWNSDRAEIYRRQERIPTDLGTAVNVQSMVFGNLGPDSGTGVCFTRDPGTGHPGVYGDYLQNAQGEDVVAGIRNTLALDDLAEIDPEAYAQLRHTMDLLEGHYKDLCDIEFTVERGKLWMLQTRVGKRTAAAAFRIAVQLVDEGVIDMNEAVRRVSGDRLAQLMFPQFSATSQKHEIARGVAASPGAAVGQVVFDSARAVELAERGVACILVRRETNPDDLAGMIAAKGILTTRGGKTSHAAVVARGMGKTAVCGAESLDVDVDRKQVIAGDVELTEGDVISIDGSNGRVYLGEVAVVPPPVVEYFEGGIDAGGDGESRELVKAVHRIMSHADSVRRLKVRANADTPEDAARARRFGAGGIGLCRTEHMFLGSRRKLVERMIIDRTPEGQAEALGALAPLQREDFIGLFTAMDGLPVTVRLIDPPLHEFLPDMTEVSVDVAVAIATGQPPSEGTLEEREAVLDAVRRLHEQNPMLGLRGVRLGIVLPGLFVMQVRAIAEAAAECIRRGLDPRPEIMIPLVSSVREIQYVRAMVEGELSAVIERTGVPLRIPIGTMIEVPRAALTAARIAEYADFFSFGTNDLTQMVFGFSRDDVESSFVPRYMDLGILGSNPFETIDRVGVGQLVRMASDAGRRVKPDLKLSVCGEHGGDAASVDFFHEVGLDSVSCSPFRVPVARLEAGRAVLLKTPVSVVV